ncbi:MAG TPA: hydroxymethylbilane synthase [Methanomicrobiales archaeon]|jgi:hydroxymethylbilane synthase|nr:hydroxymethylbilane synthase [Methanomicrobiales archaeon]
MPLVIGTRGSKLALLQAERVCRILAGQGVEVETEIIRTRGDEDTGVPLHEIGGQGLFVKALDDAILAGEIDCAVHSMKDIPTARPAGLVTAAILERDSPADYLAITTAMDQVNIVGTSSMRRRAQILRHDPAVEVRPLRGNVDTRIRRLLAGDYHAIVLAEAGLDRLGYRLRGFRLPPERFVPTANQGSIAVVARDNPLLIITLSSLDHTPTRRDVMAERAVIEELGAGCFTPVGVYCREGHLIAEVLSPDGKRTERIEEDVADTEAARALGRKLAEKAGDLLAEARALAGGTDEGEGRG